MCFSRLPSLNFPVVTRTIFFVSFSIGVQGLTDLLSGHLSDWEDYAGAAVGGAVGGLLLEYSGGVATGAGSAFAANLTTQILKEASGKQCEFHLGELVASTGLGAVFGGVPGKPVPGYNAGRNSMNAVLKSNRTKLVNGTIGRQSPAVAARGLLGSTVEGARGTAAAITVGAAKNRMKGTAVQSCGCE